MEKIFHKVKTLSKSDASYRILLFLSNEVSIHRLLIINYKLEMQVTNFNYKYFHLISLILK